ncbi:bifunctional diaminohydroxyphosphoribosylaminopyrimidine deaminase/5-amino-6-(5-phosphoribosylamino)uracil reductase RibD [Parvibaculum sp.]|uniref:bifunctional diaminohydroxyphosphoribosylaminopyrimidine deaminase/5-amino-6-(5-phosphoribosylamino)uracil reductase RibD n=1 Tax=Parvibaculum sp. TaxID=2024848 RepID=UPI0027176277|nr:bifunctional diaminohydroxyphosphoribosylaminopyrimidine deaminase/5-amino-6-(5-phosphoribosylamino)uracil reductase RibD [Parvibaculum sp.]MDO9127844.1 bifunctional diaminohydroxyphosphoribosylaminopyrimidine deaminase/5-amino-6-(5-phosphoribosylamino)uracil reductase RibD [Parvibaculum sp.]MDP1628255.1 bifunctional diaminohydroxyphosphoribosylaminopyrimidine deaminase/5-amino-6-(5-phosphoribosylamino)uracil reductase RibD [Parvibaculum sp.]MDP2150026.1 bifunctional diaminohydroxyphosphoribo
MVRPYDTQFMKMALALAERGLGQVAPNPAVGCVIVREDGDRPRVVGRGWTQPGGRPHAETEALRRAGALAKGATAYVSLEPCSHHGKTGPCAEALIEAGIRRVVGALADPNPAVAGRGFALLQAKGIDVTENVCAADAHYLNEGFFLAMSEKRPLVTLKIASSLDGRIATHDGHSQWITGDRARERGQLLRATHDAIMVGSATAIVDDPELTCRLPGLGDRSPVRIVADGRLRLPLTSKLVRDARKVPVWLLTLPGSEAQRRKAFEDCGVTLIEVEAGENGVMDMRNALEAIAERGITRLLVEGGSRLAASLVLARLVDRIEWFRAPKVIGGDGYPAIAALGVKNLDNAPMFDLRETVTLGEDSLASYVLRS